jgi:sugar-specific transcriptional regulator TrmB
MNEIPQELVESLIELGLLESEAKIYIALAMMNNSEVKKLIDFLGLSKPNTYESLRLLEEKGLVVLINTRPMTYQATPPDIGLETLLKTHLNAKEEAKKLFSTLDRQKFVEKSPETLWHVFGGKSIEYKIKDMIHGATKSIFLALSPKYLNYLKKLDEKNLKLDVIIFSDSQDTEQSLKKIFKGKEGNFQIVSKEDMIDASVAAVPEEELLPYKEALSMFNYENMLMLIVDDSELLFIPPVSEDSIAALNTKNKAFIMIMKIEFAAI